MSQSNGTLAKEMSAKEMSFKLIEDVSGLMDTIPEDSIVSRTVGSTSTRTDGVKVTLFGFAAGQALSDHSANQPAIVHILEGEATITLGETETHAKPGTWIYMPSQLVHSVTARTPLKLLLYMLKG